MGATFLILNLYDIRNDADYSDAYDDMYGDAYKLGGFSGQTQNYFRYQIDNWINPPSTRPLLGWKMRIYNTGGTKRYDLEAGCWSQLYYDENRPDCGTIGSSSSYSAKDPFPHFYMPATVVKSVSGATLTLDNEFEGKTTTWGGGQPSFTFSFTTDNQVPYTTGYIQITYDSTELTSTDQTFELTSTDTNVTTTYQTVDDGAGTLRIYGMHYDGNDYATYRNQAYTFTIAYWTWVNARADMATTTLSFSVKTGWYTPDSQGTTQWYDIDDFGSMSVSLTDSSSAPVITRGTSSSTVNGETVSELIWTFTMPIAFDKSLKGGF